MSDQPQEQNSEAFIGQCSSCGLKLKIPSKYLGRNVKCSSCGETFEAKPAEKPVEQPPAPPKEPAPKEESSQQQDPANTEAEAPSAKEEPAEQTPEQSPKAPEAPKQKADAAEKPAKKARSPKRSSQSMAVVNDSVTPDSLLNDFQGKKLIGLIVLAIILHAVLIFGTSFSYLRDEVFGKDTSTMSKEQKVQIALGEATKELTKIADRHGLSLEDITNKLSKGGARANKVEDAPAPDSRAGAKPEDTTTPDTAEPGTDADPADENDGRSEMEKEMMKPVKGPDQPTEPVDDNLGL